MVNLEITKIANCDFFRIHAYNPPTIDADGISAQPFENHTKVSVIDLINRT